jgi:hypothetical protein
MRYVDFSARANQDFWTPFLLSMLRSGLLYINPYFKYNISWFGFREDSSGSAITGGEDWFWEILIGTPIYIVLLKLQIPVP